MEMYVVVHIGNIWVCLRTRGKTGSFRNGGRQLRTFDLLYDTMAQKKNSLQTKDQSV